MAVQLISAQELSSRPLGTPKEISENPEELRREVVELVTVKRDYWATNADGYDDMQYKFAYEFYPQSKFLSHQLLSSILVNENGQVTPIVNQVEGEDEEDEDQEEPAPDGYYLETYKVTITYPSPEEQYAIMAYGEDDYD